MPLPRYERLAEEKKRKLLQAATAEFVAKGYEGASLNDILAAAEFGKSSYYYYFADKEDLYATVIEEVLNLLEKDAPSPNFEKLDTASFWPAGEAYAVDATNAFLLRPESIALLRPLQTMWRAMTPRLAPLIEQARTKYRSIIEVGRRLGCVRTDLDVDTLIALAEAADRALDEHFMARGDWEGPALKAHAKLVFDTLRRLLEPAKA